MPEAKDPKSPTLPERPTVEQVAAHYQVGKSTVWRWVRCGKIAPPIRLGGTTRWSRADLEAWETASKVA